MSDFTQKARTFRRAMDTDQVPVQFAATTFYESPDGDLAGLAYLASHNIDTYLSFCVSKDDIINVDQHNIDCDHDLTMFVRPSLEALQGRISCEKIYKRGNLVATQ